MMLFLFVLSCAGRAAPCNSAPCWRFPLIPLTLCYFPSHCPKYLSSQPDVVALIYTASFILVAPFFLNDNRNEYIIVAAIQAQDLTLPWKGDPNHYVMTVGSTGCVMETMYDNCARFCNHCYDPNIHYITVTLN